MKTKRISNSGQFLATGSTIDQVILIIEAVDKIELSDEEKRFFDTRIIPMLHALFNGASFARNRYFRYTETDNWASVASTIIAAFSAVPILPDQYKFIPLLIIAVISACQGGLRAFALKAQPEIDWLSSRKAYNDLIRLSIERITSTGVYATMDESLKLQAFSAHVAPVLAEVEKTIQGKIATFLSMQSPKCSDESDE